MCVDVLLNRALALKYLGYSALSNHISACLASSERADSMLKLLIILYLVNIFILGIAISDVLV
jgi:hypothetical protein